MTACSGRSSLSVASSCDRRRVLCTTRGGPGCADRAGPNPGQASQPANQPLRRNPTDGSSARRDHHAAAADVLEWLVPTGLAHIEQAWLTGDRAQAGPYPELLLERTDRAGTDVWRGELLMYLRRLGYPAGPFPGCPEPYASALRGDWRSTAEAWLSQGDPYEHAVELAESGQAEPTLEALRVLDGLGARPAVAIVRRRLRNLDVTRLPRRPQPGTLTNPAGLTDRQLEILRLVATGLSNAEIAQQLVLSPRTVDHHVSAILGKLGVPTRRDAAVWAARLGDEPSPRGVI